MFTSTITIEGRLAQDPNALAKLTELVILTNRRSQNEAGEWATTDTSRFTVKAFKKLGGAAAELAKGDAVIVAGSMVTETWTDKETDAPRSKQVILADAIGRSL